jgi:AraC-like DNA-binding protein
MRFDKIAPFTERLKPYVRHFVVSELEGENVYKVFPSPGLVIGFQYSGRLKIIDGESESDLTTAGITGISDSFKVFKNSPDVGTILVCLTEAGLAHFTTQPVHELFNESISLDNVFAKSRISETEERLGLAKTDRHRIRIVEQFLLSQLKDIAQDRLIMEAVRLIYESKGAIKIKELTKRLFISQSALEKRFKKIVGATPKKFVSIIRFNMMLPQLDSKTRSLTDICYEHGFFDQAHFIKDFRQYTGDTPEQFRRLL